MPTLQQFADHVRLHSDAGDYSATLDEIARDTGLTLPPLPPGIDHRVYEQGKCHALKRASSVLDGGSIDWPDGDALLEWLPSLLELRARRESDARRAAEDEAKRQHAEAEALAEQQNKVARERTEAMIRDQMAEAEEHLQRVRNEALAGPKP
jgi:hypothetical protein